MSRLPEGMTPAVAERLARLSDDKRLRVCERAAIIHEATGCGWREADERALSEEAGIHVQQTLEVEP